jgi:hypothetical protein
MGVGKVVFPPLVQQSGLPAISVQKSVVDVPSVICSIDKPQEFVRKL